MTKLYILYEHAAGHAVFLVKEFEEIGMLLPEVEQSVTDLSRFHGIVTLVGFSPFKTAVAALDNINCISDGHISRDLQLFLDGCIPKSTQECPVLLGVGDARLATNITETLGIKCTYADAVPEIIRGIRYHLHNLVPGINKQNAKVAQLGLGHSYSRGKVKFNVSRVDNMIIQCITLLDQLDKDINMFSMRIREWYSYHFPELLKIVPENYLYARVAGIVKDRKNLENEEALKQQLNEIVDSGVAEAIVNAAKVSMGMDISPSDLANIDNFSGRIIGLMKYRKRMSEYLMAKMETIAPSLATLVGEQVGARLIAHAGSLTNLAKAPASTVQILGAEKALFRALKSRKGNTPKYGLLFHSTFIARAQQQNKGRIARFLANKCSIASRIDCFSERPLNIFGSKLRKQVEDRLTFYATGVEPTKNIDVMKDALNETAKALATLEKEEGKEREKKKKKKKKHSETLENGQINGSIENGEADGKEQEKKKKKRKRNETLENSQINGSVENGEAEADTSVQKKKKKKTKHIDDN